MYEANANQKSRKPEKEKRRNNEKRKEKSRDAARCRRSRESDIFNDLATLLPLQKKEVEHLDKASIMRLSIAYLKVQNMLKNSNLSCNIDSEKDVKMISKFTGTQTLNTLDGFLLILSEDGIITYISENIHEFLGLSHIDLLGQPIWEYTHQCDHEELRDSLHGRHISHLEVLNRTNCEDFQPEIKRDFFLRLKCTLTSRGRSVNIKSASYKVIHITGHIVCDAKNRHLLAIARPLPHPINIEAPLGFTTFLTKHSLDMKFKYVDDKMLNLLGYMPEHLLSTSLFILHHAEDSENMLLIFKSLINKGQIETRRYRYLARYGGYVWVVTQATVLYEKQKPSSVVCINYAIRSFSTKIENWSIRRAEALWRKMREKKLAEIEALEACTWLRAAGFPQYVQWFQENLFPIDLSTVGRDHCFLENDALQSLYRRLVILNNCARIRVELQRKSSSTLADNESDDDENCALSENWTFEPQIRRWSRVVEMGPIHVNSPQIDTQSETSNESFSRKDISTIEILSFSTLPLGLAVHPNGTEHKFSNSFKRTGSERLRDGAKSFFKKIESIKTKKKGKSQSRALHDISITNKRPEQLNLFYSKSNPTSPFSSPNHGSLTSCSHFLGPIVNTTNNNNIHPIHVQQSKGDDSSLCSDSSQGSSNSLTCKRQSRFKRFLKQKKNIDQGTLSDSECHISIKENRKSIKKRKKYSNCTLNIPKPIKRGGSLNLGKNEGVITKGNINFNAWHTFQVTNRKQSVNALTLTSNVPRRKSSISGLHLLSMSCGQLQVIRKLALVTLTGLMERYCPNHKTGWQHWELPKFIKNIKSPDYKDKQVFGVPILLVLQRTGQAVPQSIQGALKWLKLNAIECVGLFRKSGVKSRISRLKYIVEITSDDTLSTYEGQNAYDVADLVKQYFRELPESVLTSKLIDTFLSIFKHLPISHHSDAVQSAVLLLPDENRDVLYYLLDFLKHISDGSMYNQMTPYNLSVCLAPSIFQTTKYNSIAKPKSNRGWSTSRELCDINAAHECLTFMINHYKSLFSISYERFVKCSFSYLDDSKVASLNSLCDGNWNAYLVQCTKDTIKEAKERSRGWVSINSFDNSIDIFYKKVGDGHPLRLWKAVTEINEDIEKIQHHIMKERHLWDANILRSKVIEQLNERSQIFQFVVGGLNLIDFCVLRSIQTDLPRGSCVIVESSIDHPDAVPLLGGIRGVILASRFLLEPSGVKTTKISYLSRVDLKGHSPDWYQKVYGNFVSQNLCRIKKFFLKNKAE
ncbi:rho GTPase-activating protein 7-like isoform X2 [Culicoides brevitarsis]|uniref:rho GTPase-activating protein 7-like isoform X2 n=1 Tax=Culicoides brevitarsis TaxID=469753 RepID=UPI00307B734C